MNYVANSNDFSFLADGCRGPRIFSAPPSSKFRHFKTTPAARKCNGAVYTSSESEFQSRSRFVEAFKEAFVNSSTLLSVDDFDFHLFDNWFSKLPVFSKEFSVQITSDAEGRRFNNYRLRYQYNRRSNVRSVKSEVGGTKVKQCFDIISQIWNSMNVIAQMDLGQGQEEADLSERAGNTIMTAQTTMDKEIVSVPDPVTLSALCNTEQTYDFEQITNRFQLFESFTLTTSMGPDFLNRVYPMPRSLFKFSTAANILAFQNFIYSDLDLEIRCVVNAPRFGTGKLILAVYPDGYDQFDSVTSYCASMMQRKHVIMDLSKTNQVVINLPNQYRRTYVRNVTAASSAKGVETANYSSLQIEILSQYRTGLDQPTSIPVQLFYRFVKAKFAGLSFREEVATQGLTDALVDVGTTLFPAAKPLEGILKRAGKILNQDKPYIGQISSVVPQPRENFSSGVGISDNIPLTLDHASTVTILDEHVNPTDPKTLIDIAKIPGLEMRSVWKQSDARGVVLVDWPVNPSAVVSSKGVVNTVPAPLKYVCNMTNFWRGTIKVRLDFVANDFHTGTVQIETLFNRVSDNIDNVASTYTKTFDLGEGQQSVEYTIPYIYDTPYRRNNIVPDVAMLDNTTKTANALFNLGDWGSAMYTGLSPHAVFERCRAYFRVTVLNPLTPIKNVSSQIEVLMTIAAGDDFEVHSLCPQQLWGIRKGRTMQGSIPYGNFPSNYWYKGSNEKDPWIGGKPKGGTRVQLPVLDNWNKFEGVGKAYEAPAVGNKGDLNGQKSYVVFQGDFSDPTADFTPGIAYRTFHTTDNQTRLKDIMRRNVLMMSGTVPQAQLISVPGTDGHWTQDQFGLVRKDGKFENGRALVNGNIKQSFWIPCFALNQYDATSLFARSAISPHAAITTLFRHWRGSLRYVFVFKKAVSSPIYISYVPQMGVRVAGVRQQYTAIRHIEGTDPKVAFAEDISQINSNVMFAETGFGTEICMPKVNPTCAVTVPFDTNLNRCVVSHRSRNNGNWQVLKARDEVSSISGHLVVQCDEAVPFDLFYSIGDDFELSDFVGCGTYLNQRIVACTADEIAQDATSVSVGGYKYQDSHNVAFASDFSDSRSRREVKSADAVETQMDKVECAVKVALPLVAAGAGYVISRNTTRIADSVVAIKDKTCKSVDDMKDLFSDCGEKAKSVAEEFYGSLQTAAASWTEVLPKGVSTGDAIELVIDVVRLIKKCDYFELSLTVLKWVCKLLNVTWKVVIHYKDEMAKCLKPLIGSLAQEQNSASDPNAGVSFFGLLLGIVGTCFGLKELVNDKKAVDLKTAFVRRMTDARGLTYFIAALNFVDYMFKSLKVVLMRLFGYVEPRAEVKQYLAANRSVIAEFIENVEIVTNPANKIMLRKPSFKVLVWKTHIMATNLKKTIIAMDPTVANMQLLNYCNQMLKFACERNTAITCSPVRYEPFVVCLEGGSGIGKSSVNLDMVCEMLSAAGYDSKGVNPVYTRTPGKKHWDGFSGDLAITYDDWMNLTTSEQVSEQIAELYELKSRSSFMPQMADLTDKGISANPRIVTLLTNNAFPDNSVNAVTTHEEAVWRRRDVLVKVRSKYSTPTKDLSSAERENFAHLEFQFTDPKNKVVYDEAAPWLTKDDFQKELNAMFVKYDQDEKENMMRELKALAKFTETETTILDDPTDVLQFYFVKQATDQIAEPEMYPSEKLKADLDKILDKIAVPPKDKIEAGVITQGFLDDAVNWMTSYFSGSGEKEREECAHCGGSTVIFVTEGQSEMERLENHVLCLACHVNGSDCCACSRPNGIKKKLGRLSSGCLKKLAVLREYAGEKYRHVCRELDKLDPITKIQLRTLLFVTGMSLLEMTLFAAMKKSGVVTQGEDESEIQVTFDQVMFDAAVANEQPSPTSECRHKMLLENIDELWVYNDGFWSFGTRKAARCVHFSRCDRDCVLKTEDGLARYAAFVTEKCDAWLANYEHAANMLLRQGATIQDSNDYLRIVPPCYRSNLLVVKSQDRWTNVRGGLTTEMDDQFDEWTACVPAWIKKALVLIGMGLGLAGAMVGVAKIIGYLLPRSTQIISSGAIQTRHFLKNRGRVVKTARVKTQSNAELKDALLDKMARNYVIIEIKSGSTQLAWMTMAGVYGRIAVMPKHFLRKIRSCLLTNDNVEILLHPVMSPNINVTYTFCESDFCESDTADLCVFTVPRSLNSFADLRRFIAKEKDLQAITTDGYMLEVPSRGKTVMKEHNLTLYGFKKEQEVQNEGDVMLAVDSLYYNFSNQGACGSFVCRENHTRPILAMHFAGTTFASIKREGYGVVLTQELFEDLNVNEVVVEDEQVKLKPAEEAKMVLGTHVEVQSLGTYPKSVFMPVKSKILPSLVQPELEPVKTMPSFLSRQQKDYPHKDSPLLLGCEKHGVLTRNFSTEEVDEVGQALWDLKYSGLKPVIAQPQRLTLKEAIGGLDLPGYEAMKLDTSMGFPYVFEPQTIKNKYIQIERDEEGKVKRVLVDKKVVNEQIRIDNLRVNGVRPFLPYVDELKDERKKIEKRMKPGATRVFCMSSIHSTISNRANFLHFSAAYTANRICGLNHAVGISRNGPEWSRLVKELSQVSLQNIVTMDYSNFGPGYNVMVNARGHQIIQDWTMKYVAGVNEVELEVLGREHYNSDHLMNDLVYRQFSGGPSGDALTVVKNGLVNEMYIMLAWRGLMSDWCVKEGKPIYPTFFEKTRLITYGDDLIMSVDDEIKEMFNGVTIKNFLASYRITATDALKTGEDVPYTDIYGASFLKSGFLKHPKLEGEWLAPLDEVTLEETPKWIRQCENHAEATEQNCEAALRDSFGQGPKFFNQQRTRLNEALVAVGLKPIHLTWSELDLNFFASQYQK